MLSSPKSSKFRTLYRWAISLIAVGLSYGALVLPIALRPDAFPIKIGQVSPSTIVAPYDLTYPSIILTEKAKKDAELSVPAVYLPADPMISKTQIDNLHLIINYINTIRSDSYSNLEEKISDLMKISALSLSEKDSNSILNFSDNQWLTVTQESVTVLERILRNNIKDYQVEDFKKSVPSLIGYTLTSDQAQIVKSLVVPFVVPNSLYSQEETISARNLASAGITPITKTYVYNQTIVTRGQIVSEEQFEALDVFGLTKIQTKTQDMISAGAIILSVSLFIFLYFRQRKLKLLHDLRTLSLILMGFVIFLYGARFLIPNRAIIPYFFPIPAFALIIATIFSLEISIIFSLGLSILAAFGLSSSLELTLFYAFSSFFAAILLGKGKRFTNFVYAAGGIGIIGLLIIISFRLADPKSDPIGLITLGAVSFLNGIASASLALLIQYFLSQLMGLPTPLHLMDLSRPDHPLQKFLLQNAPGTYQHSLQVSNIAELAAEAVGANPLLTRVGTLYHDVGKSTNPSFFVENQVPGHLDPHDDMDEIEAAAKIIAHVKDGVKLAEKYHLPPRIRDFILEHHGTQLTKYPYNRLLAKNNNDPSKVDPTPFKYPGPKPQSKETAILMLSDGCEARARAELPASGEEMRLLVEKVFNRCLQEGQLDNSPLTLNDLDTIKSSIISTLNNTHHPRIKYPESPASSKKDQS
jgi:putative nucleotidyltransferase with HDIG domain